MKRTLELLAPGGDLESIRAAIAAGADAVYMGVKRFNARNRAENIPVDELNGILGLAHRHACKVFLTLNIVIVESELPAVFKLLNRVANSSVDAVIVQDLGVLQILRRHFPNLTVHASTQLNTHNTGQIRFLRGLSVSRVNLARELSLEEITPLVSVAHELDMTTEVFVHGSYCISFSGLCYMSSVLSGNSGNRGRCSQPCRSKCAETPAGVSHPLNLKDNSAYADLPALADAGVDALKIEGRIKPFHYVHAVVEAWRRQLRSLYDGGDCASDDAALRTVFNRDFSNSYLTGRIGKDMFIDAPMSNAAMRLAERSGTAKDDDLEAAKESVHDGVETIAAQARKAIASLSTERPTIAIAFSGKAGTPLNVSVRTAEARRCSNVSSVLPVPHVPPKRAPDAASALSSETALVAVAEHGLDRETLTARFSALNDSEYRIGEIDVSKLDEGLFLPFRELTALRDHVLSGLRDGRPIVTPVSPPRLAPSRTVDGPPALAVLICSPEDVDICDQPSVDIHVELPSCLDGRLAEMTDLFGKRRQLVPWFQSVLIGKDFALAVDFLEQARPEQIVTNNTGIAHEAARLGISWIAGPELNIANSYALQCMREQPKCVGAFISSELRKGQIASIRIPEGLRTYCSICHPIRLMTTRQCLFHHVVGCDKEIVDRECLKTCSRHASITGPDGQTMHVVKTPGNYQAVFSDTNVLNTDIVADLPSRFTNVLIDLRDVHTGTQIGAGKGEVVAAFKRFLDGDDANCERLTSLIHPSANTQYNRGI